MYDVYVSEKDQKVIDAFNALTSEQIEKMSDVLKQLSHQWRELIDVDGTPTTRFIKCLPYRIEKGFRRHPEAGKMSLAMYKAWSSPRAKLKPDDLPDTARRLNVSLHWLKGTTVPPIYTNSPEAEKLFNLYKLLPSERQHIVVNIAEVLGGSSGEQ